MSIRTFLIGTLMAWTGVASAASYRLDSVLNLPYYLKANYGSASVNEKLGPSAKLEVSGGSRNLGRPGSAASSKTTLNLNLVVTRNLSEAQKRQYLAFNLLLALRKADENVSNALYDLENFHVIKEGQKDRSLNMLKRVLTAFAARTTGTKAVKDEVADLWYRLKFESSDPFANATPLKKGEPVILLFHQTGYYERSKSFVTNLRRKLDFGHSTVGIRYFGEGPERDLLINPGSKNLQGLEVGLPNKADPSIPNMVDTDNLWKWTQTQIGLRYMKLDARFLPLTKEQKAALSVLVPKVNGVNFGPAVATTNNCADGAAALINFIMPMHRTYSAKALLGIGPAIPSNVLSGGSRRFVNSGEFKFANRASDNPNPHNETPKTSYKQQSFSRRQLTTFDDYLGFEAKYRN